MDHFYCLIQDHKTTFWFHNTLLEQTYCGATVSQPTVHLHCVHLPFTHGKKGSLPVEGRFDKLNIMSQAAILLLKVTQWGHSLLFLEGHCTKGIVISNSHLLSEF